MDALLAEMIDPGALAICEAEQAVVEEQDRLFPSTPMADFLNAVDLIVRNDRYR